MKKTPNPKSRAFMAFMHSVQMRNKWIEAINSDMSIEEMKEEGINPISIKE